MLIAAAALLWGTVGVSTRGIYELGATNALSIGFFRLALAAPAMLIGCAAVLGRGALRIGRSAALLAALVGVMLGLYQAFFFTAIAHAGVAIAVLVTLCTAPVLAALMGAVLTRERLTWPVAAALVLALGGTALLIGVEPGAGLPAGAGLGVLFALGSAFSYAMITVLGGMVAGRAHQLQVNAIAFVTGAVLLLAVALPTGFVVSYTPLGWGLLLYLALVPTALAYALFLRGMRTTAATSATIVTLLEPLTSTMLAWLLFGERLGPLGLLGAVLLLGALGVLYIGTGGERRERSPQPVPQLEAE
ncbi:MAG: hypothetical protein RLZZ387_4808 [Chloroflexota bacterium]